jgi:hypothetical protein
MSFLIINASITNKMNFVKGTILICTSPQKTGCGILYVKRDSIIKAAEESSDSWNWFEIYCNKREERAEKTHSMNISNVRLATAEEAELWDQDVHYINQVKETSDVESE